MRVGKPQVRFLLAFILLMSSFASAVTLWTGTPRSVNAMECGPNEIACGFWGKQPVASGTGIACCTLAPGITLGASRTATYTTYGCEPNEVLTAGQLGNTMTCAKTNPALTLTSANGGPFNLVQGKDPNGQATNIAHCNADAGLDFILFPSGGTGWYGFCATAQYSPCAGTTASCGAPGSCQVCSAPATTQSTPFCQNGNVVRTVTTYAPTCSGNACGSTASPTTQTLQTCPNGCQNGVCVVATPTPTPSVTPLTTPTPIPTPPPQACSVSTEYTCKATQNRITSGLFYSIIFGLGGSGVVCPYGFGPAPNINSIPISGPVVPGACTKNAGSTYNRIGGCYPGDQVTATNRIQHGCAALCSGNTQFSGDGICVNLDAQGNGVCQYPNIQQCPAGPPQTVTFCQGDDLMQNTTSYAPKCTQPNLNPVDAPTCTPNNVIESFDGYPQGPFAPDGTPPQRFAGSRRLVTAASGWKIIVGGTTTSVDVRNEAGWPGNRLRISDNVNAFGTGTHYAAIQRKIRKSDSGSIEFDIYSRNTTLYAGQNGYYTPNFIIQLWELSGGYGFQEFYLNPMGMVTDGTKALGHFSFNRWHHVRIDWTQAGYDFYLDETKLNAQPIRTPPNTGAFNVTQVEFWVSERPYSQSYQTFPPVDIDNVKFPGCAGGCQPPTTTVNSVRLQTCLDGCFEGTCIQPTPTPTPTITPTPTPSITPTPVPLCRTPPRIAKFGGSSTTNINSLLSNPLAELRSVNGFTLDAPGAFKATYRSAVRICGQDIDANVTFGPGWFSINHDALDSSLVRPTQPISVILSYPSTIRNPAIYYAAGVFSDAAQIRQNGEVCPPTQCRNVAFVNGKVIFDAVGFSSYTVDEEPAATPTIQATASPTESTEPSASPQATLGPMSEESNELKIRCPVGIVAEDNVTVSAFYTPDGAPTCVGTALQVTAFANGSYQGVTYQSCDSGTGLHRFVINTTATGTFQIAARYDRLQAQCTFDAVGRTPTPTPELSEWLILAVGLAAFGLVSQNPKRH